MIDIPLSDLSATFEFGRCLGRLVFPGSIVVLIGQPGAGKTHLSRAIAEGLGVRDSWIVTSPTFVLVQEYESGRLPIFHFDAYRLSGEAEFAELGAGEYLEGQGVCLIEWGDRVARCLPVDYLRVELFVTGQTTRAARIEATGPRHSVILESCSGFLPDNRRPC
jgi:tRNA threonylcarbamoyladenosine biosynthesis protein TsaE